MNYNIEVNYYDEPSKLYCFFRVSKLTDTIWAEAYSSTSIKLRRLHNAKARISCKDFEAWMNEDKENFKGLLGIIEYLYRVKQFPEWILRFGEEVC